MLNLPSNRSVIWLVRGSDFEVGSLMLRVRQSGALALRLRGAKMRSRSGLFDEAAAAFQFPYYFGENWDAMSECLSDLDWLLPVASIVCMLEQGLEVLADEPAGSLDTLVRVLDNARTNLSSPIADGEQWDRAAVPLHWIVQAQPNDLGETAARWTAAGAVVETLPASI